MLSLGSHVPKKHWTVWRLRSKLRHEVAMFTPGQAHDVCLP